MKIGEAYVQLEARMGQLEKDFKKAQGAAKTASNKIEKEFKGPQTAMQKLGAGAKAVQMQYLAVAAAITGVTAVVVSSIKATVQHRDEIAKLSKATGIAVETLSAMEFVTERNGASLTAFTVGYRRLIQNMEDSNRGLKESQRNFEGLGINVKDANGKLRDGMSVFMEVADKLKALDNEAQRSALALKLFGRSGLSLVPMFKEGSAGIKGLVKEAERLGIVFSKERAEQAEAMADAMTDFSMALRGIKENLAGGLLPDLTLLMNILTGTKPSDKTAIASLKDEIKSLEKLRSLPIPAMKLAGFALGWEKIIEADKATIKLLEEKAKRQEKIGRDEGDRNEELAEQERLRLEAIEKQKKAMEERLACIKAEAGWMEKRESDALAAAKKINAERSAGIKRRLGTDLAKPSAAGPLGVDGVGFGVSLSAETSATLASMQENVAGWGDRAMVQLDIHGNFANMLNQVQSDWSNTFEDMWQGGKSFGDRMADIFGDILKAFQRMISEMAAQQMASGLSGLFGQALAAGTAITRTPQPGINSGIGVRYNSGMSLPQDVNVNIQIEGDPAGIIKVVKANQTYGGVLR